MSCLHVFFLSTKTEMSFFFRLEQRDGLTKHYASFTEYALESSTNSGVSSLPVPVVQSARQASAWSIPVITIIGTEVRAQQWIHVIVQRIIFAGGFSPRRPDNHLPSAYCRKRRHMLYGGNSEATTSDITRGARNEKIGLTRSRS